MTKRVWRGGRAKGAETLEVRSLLAMRTAGYSLSFSKLNLAGFKRLSCRWPLFVTRTVLFICVDVSGVSLNLNNFLSRGDEHLYFTAMSSPPPTCEESEFQNITTELQDTISARIEPLIYHPLLCTTTSTRYLH